MVDFSVEHIGIAAGDPRVLAAWYESKLGFREFFRTADEPPVIFLRDPNGTKVEIFPRKAGEASPSFEDRSALHIAVLVEDFDAAVRELESRGVRFVAEAKQIFLGGRARFFCDPEGNRLHIVHRPVSPWGTKRQNRSNKEL